MASRRRAQMIPLLGLLTVTGGFLSVGCSPQASQADKANQKRWESFQKDNQKDKAVGLGAFERRQAQLAEKKRKEAEKAGAKPGADAAPASAAEKNAPEKKAN